MAKPKKKTLPITVKDVPARLVAALDKEADEQGRSRMRQVIQILKERYPEVGTDPILGPEPASKGRIGGVEI